MNLKTLFSKQDSSQVRMPEESCLPPSLDQSADPSTRDESVERMLKMRSAERDLKIAIGGK